MRIATSSCWLLLGLSLGLTFANAGDKPIAEFSGDPFALPGENQITVTVPAAHGATVEEVDVPVMIAGANELGCLQMALLYDESLLEVITVHEGPLLPERAILDYDKTVPGRLGIGFLSGPNADSTGLAHVAGDGVLFNIRFKVLGRAGERSNLIPHQAQAWQVSDAKLSVDASQGVFTITGVWFHWFYLLFCALGVFIAVCVIARIRHRKVSAPPVVEIKFPAAKFAAADNPALKSVELSVKR